MAMVPMLVLAMVPMMVLVHGHAVPKREWSAQPHLFSSRPRPRTGFDNLGRHGRTAHHSLPLATSCHLLTFASAAVARPVSRSEAASAILDSEDLRQESVLINRGRGKSCIDLITNPYNQHLGTLDARTQGSCPAPSHPSPLFCRLPPTVPAHGSQLPSPPLQQGVHAAADALFPFHPSLLDPAILWLPSPHPSRFSPAWSASYRPHARRGPWRTYAFSSAVKVWNIDCSHRHAVTTIMSHNRPRWS
ncbi:hypothetical protein LIA77_04029 [Sarocladium implicatum]|nr:hypothetical protein LIA77_04029 [Sarocladium implicatum]